MSELFLLLSYNLFKLVNKLIKFKYELKVYVQY